MQREKEIESRYYLITPRDGVVVLVQADVSGRRHSRRMTSVGRA